MAGLIIMEPFGALKMQRLQQFANEAGDLEIEGLARPYPKIQILSVPEILKGKRFDTPTAMGKAQHPQTRLDI